MKLQYLFFIFFLFSIAPAAWAQTAQTGQPPAEEQNETMIDTLKRMQIRREEDEHKKLIGKGTQIKDEAEALRKEAAGSSLPLAAEKKLKSIEKFARQIRSESGGGQDVPLEAPPADLDAALKQLGETSERLNTRLAKTSRRVVSVSVVEDATEIIQLIKLLRSYLN